MITAVVKAYKRSYKTKSKVKPTVTVTKQINLSANSDLEADDIVYILTEAEYKSLNSNDTNKIKELQTELEADKLLIQDLNKTIKEFQDKEKLLTDTLTVNNSLLEDIRRLTSKNNEYIKTISTLKIVNEVLYNRSLIARIRNKAVNIDTEAVNLIETDKE